MSSATSDEDTASSDALSIADEPHLPFVRRRRHRAVLAVTRQTQRPHLHRADTPPELFGEFSRSLGTMIAAFAVSIPVAFFTHYANACWTVIPLVGNLLFRLRRLAARA
jgi:hypothetical protein